MPNWTYNTITTNNPEIIPQFMTDGEFNFNKLIPMPESLNIESGSITDQAVAYYLSERLTKSAKEVDLSRYIYNFFDHKWAETVVDRLKGREMSEEEADKLYAMGEQYIFNLQNYGAYSWYEWCNINWSTKWNSSGTSFDENHPCEISFDTAWSAPENIFRKLCELYPDAEIKFHCEYEEGFVVEFENQNGELVITNEYSLDSEDDDWNEEDEEDEILPF